MKLLYSSQANHVFKAFGLWLKVLSNKNMLISGPTQPGKPGKLWSLALKRPVQRKIPLSQEHAQYEGSAQIIGELLFRWQKSLPESGK